MQKTLKEFIIKNRDKIKLFYENKMREEEEYNLFKTLKTFKTYDKTSKDLIKKRVKKKLENIEIDEILDSL